MGKILIKAIMASLAAVTLLSGCGKKAEDNSAGLPAIQNSEVNTSGADAAFESEESRIYPATFIANGSNAELYSTNIEKFQQEFLAHYTETGESQKVRGYDEPITVSTVNFFSASMEDAASKMGTKYGESLTENRWTDAFKRLYNIDVSYEWQAQDADYNQKLRLDMASGELPDIFIVRSQSDLLDLARQGLIWDLTDIMEQYGTEYDKNVWKTDNGAALQMATLEGRIYGMPSNQSATDAVSYLWIRKDWLQKLGLSEPKTLEELKEVMESFVKNDPDGNGVNDTWGLYMRGDDLDYPVRGLYAAYGSYPNSWYEKEDGTVIYGGIDETTKDALAYLADIYRSGLINPEFVAMDTNKANEMILNNKAGIVYAGHWFGHTAGDLHEMNPDSDWKCIPLPGVTGERVKSLLAPVYQGWVAVNKDFEYPEIALKMRSLVTYALLCDESAWWWYEDNVSWNMNPVRCNVSAFDNLNTYNNLQEAYNQDNDESLLRAKGVPYWANLHGENQWEWELMFGPGEGTAFSVLKESYDKGDLFWDAFHGEQSELMQNNWSTIQDEQKQAFTDIIIGKVNAEEGFEKWINTWNALDGEEISEYVNTWIQENP